MFNYLIKKFKKNRDKNSTSNASLCHYDHGLFVL